MEDKDELSGESEREFGDDDNHDNNNVHMIQHVDYPTKWSWLHEKKEKESNNKMAQLQHSKVT